VTPRRRATLIWAGCLVVAMATLVLLALGAGESTPADSFGLSGYGGLSFVVASLAFAAVGAMVAARVPANPIGWIFCFIGVILGVGDFLFQYADQTLFISPDRLPGGAIAAWSQNLGLPPAFGLLGVALLLFPDGRLPSRRWRPALWLALAGIALIVIAYALRPGPLDDPFAGVSNPFGIAGAFELIDALGGFGWMFMGAAVAIAALGTSIRLRRSHGLERAQLKWLAFAAAAAGVAVVSDVISYFVSATGINELRNVVLGLGFAVFPVAAGAAILRYRLFDIDVVINRTLVYGALTATLAGAYLGSVLLLQVVLAPLTADSGLAIAASTLAVAALFRPARARIQDAVDRQFYRHRYDAAQTLEAFGTRLRDEVDLEAVGSVLRAAVRDTVQPAHFSLWLPLDARDDFRTDGT
jgi:hypothetical protein